MPEVSEFCVFLPNVEKLLRDRELIFRIVSFSAVAPRSQPALAAQGCSEPRVHPVDRRSPACRRLFGGRIGRPGNKEPYVFYPYFKPLEMRKYMKMPLVGSFSAVSKPLLLIVI